MFDEMNIFEGLVLLHLMRSGAAMRFLFLLALAILFEGDLKLSKAEIKSLKENTISKRDAIASEASKWPNGRVPYILSPELGE